MGKQAKDFYIELEQTAKPKEFNKDFKPATYNKEYVERMSRTPFPTGKVILLFAGIVFTLISNFPKIATHPYYINKIRPLPVVDKIYKLAEVNDKEMNNEIIFNFAKDNNIEMVQIRGRYFPKSADNTYVVDGETVFFVDKNAKNRK